MDLSDRIISILEEEPGQRAKLIAEKLGVDKKEINNLLHGRLQQKVWKDKSYRWYLNDYEKESSDNYKYEKKSSSDTPLKRLCKYYIDCLSHDDEQGVSAFASNQYGDLDYVELDTFPLASEDEFNPFATDEVKKLWSRIKRDKSRLTLFLGYPTRLRWHKAKHSGWQGFFVEPIFLFQFEIDPSRYNAFPELSSDLPIINFKALKPLTEGGSTNILEEVIALASELGFDNDYDDLPDNDEFLQKLQEIRTEWDWLEDINPYELNTNPPLSHLEKQGIYNRAIFISGEKSPYTHGLEIELKALSELSEDKYQNTALGRWINDIPDDKEEDGRHSVALLEVFQMNNEERVAVRNSLTRELTVITGPPGTGKSQVVTNLLINAAWNGIKVLFASKNNKAVDVVEERVNGIGTRPILLRLGSNEYQGKLAEYLVHLLSATTTNDDQIEYDEFFQNHKSLLQNFQEINSQLMKNIDARNCVDESEKVISKCRDEFGNEKFNDLRSMDIETAELDIKSLQNALLACHRKKQNLFVRLFWLFISKKRFQKLLEASERIIYLSNDFALNTPSEGPNKENLSLWVNFCIDLKDRMEKAKKINKYFKDLESFLSQPTFEDLAVKQLNLIERMSDNSTRLWQQWIKLQPQRLKNEDKKLINDYAAILQLMVRSKRKIDSKVYRQYIKLVPKVSNLLPCWAVTSLSARNKVPFEPGYFDILVIDEASQCDIASAMPLLYRAKHAVIIGDPNQLSHISSISYTKDTQLQEKHNIVENFASWMYSVNSLYKLASGLTRSDDIISLLDHHRSHADIIEFSNRFFYGGNLRIATRYNNLRLVDDGKPTVRWTDIKGKVRRPLTGGAINEIEAKSILKEIENLIMIRNYEGTVGVVSPFRAQANYIRELVFQNESLSNRLMRANFLVDTVHKFQGDERDVMFFSPVVSEGIGNGPLLFLKRTGNLFNVAITRARSMLHVIGDKKASLGSGVDYLSKFVSYTSEAGEHHTEDTRPEKMDYGPEYPTVSNPERVSEWERYFYSAIYTAGIRPIPQFNVEQYVLDFALFSNERKLNIEIDGERYHRNWNGEICRRDQIRNQRLIELGWNVKRYWVYEVRDELEKCVNWVKTWLSQ
jgi:very-short-patch-repair endonuclease